MEYFNTPFTRPVRLALLVIFVVIFCIITPIIIAYTAGYRYDWGNGVVRETGGLSVDEIIPKSTNVFVNGLKTKEGLPLRLKSLTTPGTYTVLLSAPGYFDWQKQVDILSKQTVYIKQIRLLKKDTPTLITKGLVDTFSLSPDARFALYTTHTSTTNQLWWYNASNDESKLLLTLPISVSSTITWAEKNNFALITRPNAPYKSLLLVNAETPDVPALDLAQISPEIITKFVWDTNSEPQLFFQASSTLYTYFPKTNKLQTVAPLPYLDWTVDAGVVWGLTINTNTQHYVVIKDVFGFATPFKELEKLPGITSSSHQNNPVQFLAARRNTALLKEAHQPRMFLLTPNDVFTFAGNSFRISPYNSWWLFWTPWEIWTYAEGSAPSLLNRSGEQLRDLLPLDTYNTLALVWPSKITALFPYYLINHTFVNQHTAAVAADSQNHILYYSEQKDGKGSLFKLPY